MPLSLSLPLYSTYTEAAATERERKISRDLAELLGTLAIREGEEEAPPTAFLVASSLINILGKAIIAQPVLAPARIYTSGFSIISDWYISLY